MIRRFKDFDIQINIRNDEFIKPPRPAQRTWLLNQSVDELARDLSRLDEIASGFVPGRESHERGDYQSGELEDQQIMEDWLIPIMRKMAAAATRDHGHVLEIGFGRGIASGFIQEGGVSAHTIVECSDEVVEKFHVWRNQFPDRDIRLIHGKWQDVVDELEIYDSVFFHSYALDEQEYLDYALKSVTFAEHFFPTAAAHLREGGVFTYPTHEIDSFSRAHQRLVFDYFSSFRLSKVEALEIPPDTVDAWWADSMVVIEAVK